MELKSSATFPAIKRCQWTKFGEVVHLALSLLKRWSHICHHMGKAINSQKPLTPWPGGLLFFQCVDSNGGGIYDIDLVVMCVFDVFAR